MPFDAFRFSLNHHGERFHSSGSPDPVALGSRCPLAHDPTAYKAQTSGRLFHQLP